MRLLFIVTRAYPDICAENYTDWFLYMIVNSHTSKVKHNPLGDATRGATINRQLTIIKFIDNNFDPGRIFYKPCLSSNFQNPHNFNLAKVISDFCSPSWKLDRFSSWFIKRRHFCNGLNYWLFSMNWKKTKF